MYVPLHPSLDVSIDKESPTHAHVRLKQGWRMLPPKSIHIVNAVQLLKATSFIVEQNAQTSPIHPSAGDLLYSARIDYLATSCGMVLEDYILISPTERYSLRHHGFFEPGSLA